MENHFQVRVSAASTWASSTSSTNVTVNGDIATDIVVTPFNVHRVSSASHSYRSLTPLNMDLSEGHATTVVSKLATATSATSSNDNSKSNETSLEMIKVSLTASSGQSEDQADQTEAGADVSGTTDVTVNNSLSDRTLGPELPSLPTDQFDQGEPVSLSQIQLEEN